MFQNIVTPLETTQTSNLLKTRFPKDIFRTFQKTSNYHFSFHPRRNINRTNAPDARCGLRTFKAAQDGGFRGGGSGGSPSRSARPALADLEFPPPPADLPPPPEEPPDQADCAPMTSSQELRRRAVPVSPAVARRSARDGDATDVSTLQPSVEEASSRWAL